jgi:iron complex outermembrane recepter protein
VSGVLRALPLCAPVALAIPAAVAQSVEPAKLIAAIPSQPLAQALAAFARQTDLHLVYVSGIVRNQKSHAVPAGLGARAALTRLLEGTGLRFEYLTANSVRILTTAPPPETGTWIGTGDEPYEVVVTANRREENFQNVPITIQTITGDQLNQLSVTTFNDLLQHTPNVTYTGNGPGTGNIVIRGLGSVATGNQSQSTIAPFPNVALYLDDQPMQYPARNNDVYLADIARVEVLEGPQGTMFGGGAQAGVVRYVTSKPNVTAASGEFTAGYGITTGGNPNSSLTAMLNVPLIPETLALRAVFFSERRGGYITNVPATIAFPPNSTAAVSGGNPVANNAFLAAPNTNPVTYGGFRLSGLYQLADDWSLLIQQNYQDMHADGYFYAYPSDPNGRALAPYQITAFSPAFTKDRYASTAWTLNGSFGDLKAVYTGSYLTRHIEGEQDYSNYLRSVTGSYYACIGPGAGYFNPNNYPTLPAKPLACYAPVGSWHDTVDHTHHSEDLRLSTNEDRRLRGIFGAFWEKFVIRDRMDFNYLSIPQCDPPNLAAAETGGPVCLSAVGPVPGTYANDPSLRTGSHTAFGTDVQRGYTQYAFFASIDFDLIPKTLTLTGGTRWYNYDEFEYGSEFYTVGGNQLIINHPNGACTAVQGCGIPLNLEKSESGFSSRANLTWRITPDIMTYYTYSQGFRPGGFNRTFSLPGEAPLPPSTAQYCGAASTDPRCLPGGSLFGFGNTRQSTHPVGYGTDNLINNELGFKSELLNHRLLVNADLYRMTWNDVQSYVFDPGHLGNATWVANGPSYAISGTELQLIARVTEGLTLQGSSAWNSTGQSNTPCLISAGITPSTPYNPTPAGQCVTIVKGLPYTTPWGAHDTPAPFAPPLMFNVRVRYDWSLATCRPFAMFGASHIAAMSNAPASFPDGNAPGQTPPTTTLLKFTIPAYTAYDAALGVVKDNWTAQVTGSNLSNAYAATNVSAGLFIKAAIPLRPRVLMALLAYRF